MGKSAELAMGEESLFFCGCAQRAADSRKRREILLVVSLAFPRPFERRKAKETEENLSERLPGAALEDSLYPGLS
jgi:hypothetical protein